MDPPECIVLVSIDDLRHDCLSCHADLTWVEKYDATKYRDTPTLDQLAAEGHRFADATATASHTPPTHASMLTGQYPKETGVKTFFTPLRDDQQTVAEYLSEKGYRTVAWVENLALDDLRITAGFDKVVSPFEQPDLNLFEFVRDNAGENVFLFVHLFDVHKPYLYTTGGSERRQYNTDYLSRIDDIVGDIVDTQRLMKKAPAEAANDVQNYRELTAPLQEYADRRAFDYLLRKCLESNVGEDRFEYLVKLYVDGVAKFDRGRFADLERSLSEVLPSNSLQIITADHGETRCEIHEREDLMNGPNVSEGAVRVPLIITGGFERRSELGNRGAEFDGDVNHIDIFPTIAALFGDHVDVSGESIFEVVADGRTDPVFHETWNGAEGADFFGNFEVETGEGGLGEAGVRKGQYKMVYATGITGRSGYSTYNVEADLLEETDVTDELPTETRSELRDTLDSYLAEVSLDISVDDSVMGGDERGALEERLNSLGYLDDV